MNIREVLKITHGNLSKISIDSRTIKRGELFIAIKGKIYDGHDFIKEAVGKGASGVVASFIPPRISLKVPAVIVVDTIRALGDIAMFYRRKFNIPVVGITGSNGKTTVKEMIAHILKPRFNVLKNRGTENNFIGLPLTLLRIKPSHQAAVLELGANRIGEIDRLSQILNPTIALITNIGPSHLEYFGDLNTVLKAKSEILNYVSRNSVVLNGDDSLLVRICNRGNPITFGIGKRCGFRGTNIVEKKKTLEFDLNSVNRFRLNLLGRYNIYNGLAGIAVASTLGMDFKTIQKRLATFRALPMRMRMSSINGVRVIDDTYNSNPLSSKCAIQSLSDFKTRGRKILVTGDMLELGGRSRYYHKEIGKLIADSLIDSLITVGELSKETFLGARMSGMKTNSVWNCKSVDKAASILANIARTGDIVLIKGSRAMGMERVIEGLQKRLSGYPDTRIPG